MRTSAPASKRCVAKQCKVYGDTCLVMPAFCAAFRSTRWIAARLNCVPDCCRWCPKNSSGPGGRYAFQYVRSASRTRGLRIVYRGPVFPARTWISIRLLSMSTVCSPANSPTRRPAP